MLVIFRSLWHSLPSIANAYESTVYITSVAHTQMRSFWMNGLRNQPLYKYIYIHMYSIFGCKSGFLKNSPFTPFWPRFLAKNAIWCTMPMRLKLSKWQRQKPIKFMSNQMSSACVREFDIHSKITSSTHHYHQHPFSSQNYSLIFCHIECEWHRVCERTTTQRDTKHQKWI